MAEQKKTQAPKSNLPEQAADELTPSQRFAKTVQRLYLAQTGLSSLSDRDIRLIQNYFVGIDRTLKMSEIKRLQTNAKNRDHKFDNDLAYAWPNVDMEQLSIDVVANARVGLDLLRENMIHAIPYKDNHTNKYRLTLMKGYNGIRYEAEKYAVDPPKNVRTELIYETDLFEAIMKDSQNDTESYVFRITQPFSRGAIIGGFAYLEFDDDSKNKLLLMSVGDINKRKPKYASGEFWGGIKSEWQDGKKVEVETDGWYAEMALKTLKREAYSAKHIPRDPSKIDEAYQALLLRENEHAEAMAKAEISANANGEMIDITPPEQPQNPPKLPPQKQKAEQMSLEEQSALQAEYDAEMAKLAFEEEERAAITSEPF